MFPMITTLHEFLRAKNTFEQCYEVVSSADPKVAKRDDIELGLMIETPASAGLTEQFCKYGDFDSIGTKDLIQYSMASDRMNKNVSYV
ncbi:putative PEP-binding protein, partial [Mycoplasmopsis synoviae]